MLKTLWGEYPLNGLRLIHNLLGHRTKPLYAPTAFPLTSILLPLNYHNTNQANQKLKGLGSQPNLRLQWSSIRYGTSVASLWLLL